ncbi:hypothetical protein KRP22_002738 [Phytophthora ramorum]|nr:hypothetical protein KRP22_6385 [Phytophthora ramorum]
MRREVEYLKMHLQLDPAELRRALFNGIPEYGIAPFPTRDVKQTYRVTVQGYSKRRFDALKSCLSKLDNEAKAEARKR